jgi:hypothetical protein
MLDSGSKRLMKSAKIYKAGYEIWEKCSDKIVFQKCLFCLSIKCIISIRFSIFIKCHL